jgi:hypothetical protein
MKKGTTPAGAIDQAQDEFFERSAVQALRDMPTASEWASALGIWSNIGKAWPSTRRRILAEALRLCSERQQPPPDILVAHVETELVESMVPRARAKDADLMREVAHYLVRHPRTSHRKIAAALGKPREFTIYRNFEKPEFWKLCADESARFDDQRKHKIFEQYVRRFGPTFEYATDRTRLAALSDLVPFMIDALEGRAPPLTDDMVCEIVAKRSEIRSEAALKARLMHVAR